MKTFQILAVTVLILAAGILSSCNTTAGAGQDIKQTGQGITNAANRVQSGY